MLNIEVVRTVSIRLKNLPTEQEAEIMSKYLFNKNPAIRFRIARCISTFALIDLGHILNLFYEKIVKLLSNIESDHGRCGAIELLYLLSGLEHGLLGATSLLAPLALSSISDKVEHVRETAASTFRKLIALLPLEHVSLDKDKKFFNTWRTDCYICLLHYFELSDYVYARIKIGFGHKISS